MAKLFFVRHGESVANIQGIYQGQTYDTDLSQLGIKQSQATAGEFYNGKVEQIYCSPLKRTHQTAEIIARKIGLKPKVDRRIIEINHGDWEGMPKSEIKQVFAQSYHLWKTNPSQVQMPNGENCRDVLNRSLGFIEEMVLLDQNIIVVSHDMVIRLLLAHWKKLNIDNIWKISLDNGGITLVSLDQPIRVEYINKDLHLQTLKGNITGQAR